MLKHRHQTEEDKKLNTRMMIEKYKMPWTCDELTEEIMGRIKQLPFEFVFDDDNQRLFELLCLYYSGDERFNEQEVTYPNGDKRELNLKKGIGLISAKKGTGKSILMGLFQQNRWKPYLLLETKNVSAMFQKKGEEAIEVHSNLLHVPPTPLWFYRNDIGICFDDLGFELPKNSWGNKSDVMSDVLFSIYSKNQWKGDFSNFSFTSNLSGTEFENRYDDRVRDRMREMFNVIPVGGESRRK